MDAVFQGEPGGNARSLAYFAAADLDRFGCRPLGQIDVLDLTDRRVGHLDGIIVDRRLNSPIFLVIAEENGELAAPRRGTRLLVPVGDAWFDDTERAVRIDLPGAYRITFDSGEFESMTMEQADEFERGVLAACCPEVGLHRDGRPDYERLKRFRCPAWLRPAQAGESGGRSSA
jgi:hypothetical protein